VVTPAAPLVKPVVTESVAPQLAAVIPAAPLMKPAVMEYVAHLLKLVVMGSVVLKSAAIIVHVLQLAHVKKMGAQRVKPVQMVYAAI
jgi:hypothetical protein